MRIEVGDIVAVKWIDHFRFKGDEIPSPLEVISWGKVIEDNEDGIALVQNEVAENNLGIDRIMDGQFILKPAIKEIKKI